MGASTNHWQQIHQSKYQDVSWWQSKESLWLDLIDDLHLAPESRIIDVGAGASLFVDGLIERGFQNMTILDIASAALLRTRERLGKRGESVIYEVCDVLDFQSEQALDLWYDRAVFHFLTSESDQERYVNSVRRNLSDGGTAIIIAFSKDGPEECSGLPVERHNAASLQEIFGDFFTLEKTEQRFHVTPWNTKQAFTISVFKKRTRLSE